MVKTDPPESNSFIPQAIENPPRFNDKKDLLHCAYHSLSFDTRPNVLKSKISSYSEVQLNNIGRYIAVGQIEPKDGKADKETGQINLFERVVEKSVICFE